jgi:hypothetical protein
MRVLLSVALLILLVSPAFAKSDVSIEIGASSRSHHYSYGVTDWTWGDPIYYGTQYRQGHNGLYVSYHDGDWGARFRRDSIIGTHPNDRGGYRAFIPRGQTGVQYYGDYRDGRPVHQYPLVRRDSPYYRSGYPVVINYSYGYPYYYYNPPVYSNVIYTAPSNPQLGYYRDYRDYQDYRHEAPRMDTQPSQPEVYVEGDYNVYNYYSNELAQSQAEPDTATYQQPSTPPTQQEPSARAIGTRFYGQSRLETAEGVYSVVISEGNLFVGPDVGPGQEIAWEVNESFGGYLAYLPGAGIVVIFRQADWITAAYQLPEGGWWLERMPYEINYNETPTIGLVSGVPWVTFNAMDGRRYVVSFTGRNWVEVGSAY